MTEEIKLTVVEAQKIDLQPGDCLFVKVPPFWSMDKQGRLADIVRQWAPKGVRILVGPSDTNIKVIRPND